MLVLMQLALLRFILLDQQSDAIKGQLIGDPGGERPVASNPLIEFGALLAHDGFQRLTGSNQLNLSWFRIGS